MRKFFPVLSVILLPACGDDLSPAEQRTADEAAIATVEALQTPAPDPIDPEPIRYPDIEKYDLFGAGCNFAPDGGGLGAIVLAQADVGYMKIDGTIERFAPDVGSSAMPLDTRAKYDGTSHSFRLALLEEDGEPAGMETTDFRARLTVLNSSDLVVYEAEGIVQCGS